MKYNNFINNLYNKYISNINHILQENDYILNLTFNIYI